MSERKTVLITGSSRGIGAAAARRFAQEGWGVGLHCRAQLDRAAAIRHVIDTAPGHVLALSSEFGRDVFVAAQDAVGTDRGRYDSVAVPNRTFGGTIHASGLLCCSDYEAAFAHWCESHPRPAGVIVPGESFNSLGRDLKGVHVAQLSQALGVPVVPV